MQFKYACYKYRLGKKLPLLAATGYKPYYPAKNQLQTKQKNYADAPKSL